MLDISEIKSRLPHRFNNLILDSANPYPAERIGGHFSASIQEKDNDGRALFFKQWTTNQKILIPIFNTEIMALGSIVNTGPIDENKLAIFAGIQNYRHEGIFPINTNFSGESEKKSARHGFYKYTASVKCNADESSYCSASVTAYYADKSQLSKQTSIPDLDKDLSLPTFNLSDSIQKPTYKDPEMFVAETCHYYDAQSHELVVSYQYPYTHPCVKGHFPGNPLMMGVMQWMMVEDAAYVILQHLKSSGKKGRFTLNCDATISNKNQQVICEVKKASVKLFIDEGDIINQTELYKTNKIVFKERVHPKETLFAHLKNITLESV